jgi:hypothetical protein
VKLGVNASDTYVMLSEAYGGEAMKKSSVFEWFKRFKEGLENVTNENVEKVRNLVHSDRRLNVRSGAVQLNFGQRNSYRRRKRPEPLPKGWILHHDNAPAHKALSVKQFLAQKSITETEHSSYSPDFSPNDFWLFPKIKSALKGRKFQDIEDIQKNLTMALKAIPQQEFQNISNSDRQHRWATCIAAQREHFKGDPSQ